MKSVIRISKNHTIPVSQFASQANAVLGTRDSGKTYTAMKSAEELMLNNIPITVLDPVGVWKNLRIGVNGNKGFPVIVAGGDKTADIILTADNAEDIMRAAMKSGISIVFDFFSPSLSSKNIWKKIVLSVMNVLFYENKSYGLRHIYLEEAAEFVPQMIRPETATVYDAVERMARMGRNSSLGMTIINQRAQQVNKAVLELCSLTFIHKQLGKNALESIKKWLEYLGHSEPGTTGKIMSRLPSLQRGECVIIDSNSKDWWSVVNVSAKRTFHPSPENGVQSNRVKSNVNISSFIKKLNTQLSSKSIEDSIVQNTSRSETKKIKSLNDIIIELKKQLSEKDSAIRMAIAVNNDLKKHLFGMESSIKEYAANIQVAASNISKISKISTKVQAIEKGKKMIALESFSSTPEMPILKEIANPEPRNIDKIHSNKTKVKPWDEKQTFTRKQFNGSNLPSGEHKVLVVLAQHNKLLLPQQITAYCGYKRSSRDAFISRLLTKGLVRREGKFIEITADGKNFLGNSYEKLPTGAALIEHHIKTLPHGESVIFEYLSKHWPDWVQKDVITEKTNYQRSSRDAFISRLATKQLIQAEQGRVRAASYLFE